MTIIEQSKKLNTQFIRERNSNMLTSRPGRSVLVACQDDQHQNKRVSDMKKNWNDETEHAVVDPGQLTENSKDNL
jgi:hypothetical protein